MQKDLVSVSVDTDTSGEPRLCAHVVAKHGNLLDITALKAFLRKRLPEYMVPSAVMIVQSMPRTENGKLDRKSLPKFNSEAQSPHNAFAPPASNEETVLCGIWAEVLGLTTVGVNDDVFSLGADSLHIFKIAARANKAGLAVDALQIFERRTVAELARYLRIEHDTFGAKSANGLRQVNGRL